MFRAYKWIKAGAKGVFQVGDEEQYFVNFINFIFINFNFQKDLGEDFEVWPSFYFAYYLFLLKHYTRVMRNS